MRVEFVSIKLVKFYLKTKSPLLSKIKVITWFLIRTPLRLILSFKTMKNLIKPLENQKIFSIMLDNAKFINTIEQIVNLYEIYGEKKQELVSPPNSPLTIVDIGAHVGIFSIKFAYKFPKAMIYSIEPEKQNFNSLKKNIKLNDLKNITPLKLAFFNKNGYLELGIDPFGSGQHSLLKRASKEKERVKVITLDSFRKKINRKIDLIKIDTEGSEYEILLGGITTIKRDKPFLIIETHPWYDPEIDKKIISLIRNVKGYKWEIKRNKGSTIFAWVKK